MCSNVVFSELCHGGGDGGFDVVVRCRNVFWGGCYSFPVPLESLDEWEVVAECANYFFLPWPCIIEVAGSEKES